MASCEQRVQWGDEAVSLRPLVYCDIPFKDISENSRELVYTP